MIISLGEVVEGGAPDMVSLLLKCLLEPGAKILRCYANEKLHNI